MLFWCFDEMKNSLEALWPPDTSSGQNSLHEQIATAYRSDQRSSCGHRAPEPVTGRRWCCHARAAACQLLWQSCAVHEPPAQFSAAAHNGPAANYDVTQTMNIDHMQAFETTRVTRPGVAGLLSKDTNTDMKLSHCS